MTADETPNPYSTHAALHEKPTTMTTKGETAMKWTGRVLSTLIGLALLASAVMKFAGAGPEVDKELARIGVSPDLIPTIAIIEIGCALLYLFPPTAVVGAILVTGYMGGAIMTHLRIDDPPIAQIVLPILAWLGIYLRDKRLWRLIPWRTSTKTEDGYPEN